jgi:murein DD-endopeptidase MepM/ murein hydrolase activator NlpD
MKRTVQSLGADPEVRKATVNMFSVLKYNKMLLVSFSFVCIVATGIFGFTLGGIADNKANATVINTDGSIALEDDIAQLDVLSLEIEKLDTQKKNKALQEQNRVNKEATDSIADTVLGSLMSNLESKKITNRSASVDSFVQEAKNLIVLNRKLTAFKKTADYKLIDISSYEKALTTRLTKIPTLKPISGSFRGFGGRRHPIYGYYHFHPAADQSAPYGTRIKAAGAGYVVKVGYDGSSGNNLVINHGNGFTTSYLHASVILVKAGQSVKKGDIIAKVGSTGSSTAPHLHFEVAYNGTPFNPQKILIQ